MRRLLLFFGFIAAQLTLALLVAYLALNASVRSDAVASGVSYVGNDYSGEAVHVARDAIIALQAAELDGGVARFQYQNTEFTFSFSEVGLAPDIEATEAALDVKRSPFYLNSLFTGFVRQYGGAFKPQYRIDPAAFREKLDMMKDYIDVAPVDADVNCTPEGELTRSRAADGALFDVDARFDAIYAAFAADPLSTYRLDAPVGPGGELAVSRLAPRVTDVLLADVDTLLAETLTDIPAGCDMAVLNETAAALNKVWIPRSGASPEPFSFLRYIEEAGLPADAPRREYDAVATALLNALLVAGADYAGFEYEVAEDGGADGALPGFGAALLGGETTAARGGGDFRYKNSLPSNIVWFVSVAQDGLSVRVAGDRRLAGENAAPHAVRSSVGGYGTRLFRDGGQIAEIE